MATSSAVGAEAEVGAEAAISAEVAAVAGSSLGPPWSPAAVLVGFRIEGVQVQQEHSSGETTVVQATQMGVGSAVAASSDSVNQTTVVRPSHSSGGSD